MSHAAFFGIGAYVVAILTTNFGFDYFSAMGIGIVVVLFISMMVGLVLSKFKEDYYALGSMAFCVIVYNLILNFRQVTNGPLGVAGIPRPTIFGILFSSSLSYLFLVLAFFVIVAWLAFFISRSPFCKILMSIREDEGAIQAYGYNIKNHKLIIFVFSSVVACVAGTLLAPYLSYIDPTMTLLVESIFILTIVIFGGLANVWGSILGAFLLILIPELLRFAGFPLGIEAQMRQFIFGAILIVLMFFRPQGILGKFKL
jgi:branched-chain amino acid transport system permease protein